MHTAQKEKNNKQVAIWLMIGVLMIVIQVLIGGITRLTESGLSITEWEPIKGALPPLNDAAWQAAFEKYKGTDQYKYVHQSFTLGDFKFIYFWEWFHRLWARLLGVVFLVGFIYFLLRKKLNRQMIVPMIVLFALGALQGLIGWIMVKSGLLPMRFNVGHVELSTHFVAAIVLMAYTFWFALSLIPAMQNRVYHRGLKNLLQVLIILVFLQLVYGGLMAGLKAAAIAPTWPHIHGKMIPDNLDELHPFVDNFINNPLMVHFMHRGLAYLIFIVGILFYIRANKLKTHKLFHKFNHAFIILICLQVTLGIITVLHGADPRALLWYGVAHQFVAMILVICLVCLWYLTTRKNPSTSQL